MLKLIKVNVSFYKTYKEYNNNNVTIIKIVNFTLILCMM